MNKSTHSSSKVSLLIKDPMLMNRLRDIFEQNNFEVLSNDFVNSSMEGSESTRVDSADLIVMDLQGANPSIPVQNEFLSEHLRIFKTNQTIQMVEKSRVSHIFANRELSMVHLSCGQEVVSLKPLAYYQKVLACSSDFYRVHNNALINLQEISEYSKKDNLLRMKSGANVVCSRRKGRALYVHFFLK
jgi:hypothetical protein